MTLEDYRLEEGLTYARLATLLSTEDQRVTAEMARRWCLPEGQALSRVPSPVMLRRIYAVTDGRVTANDFAGIPRDE